MRPHRHQLLPKTDLQPTNPIRDVPLDIQAESMRRLRAAHNQAALGYRERDGLMTAWALSNSLSRQDMAVATGLAKSRVDQIIRETYEHERATTAQECAERVARHMP
jgi:hypothetical protein